MPLYSQDLRKRVIDTVERGDCSVRQIAKCFLVSPSFVTRLLQHYRKTGSLDPKPQGSDRKPALGPAQLKQLQALDREQPDATLEELRQRLGVDCSISISHSLDQTSRVYALKGARARGNIVAGPVRETTNADMRTYEQDEDKH